MITGVIAGCMYEGYGGYPRGGGMAHITLLGSDKVSGILAGGACAVVTG